MSAAASMPEERRSALAAALDALGGAQRVVLTTHVNADGDGAGSEAALGSWLAARGARVAIVNPTPFPALFRHLVAPGLEVLDATTEDGQRALREADLFVVLDTGEPRRIGRLLKAVEGRPTVVIDHHPEAEGSIPGVRVLDPAACATGELIYDLLLLADPEAEWPEPVAEALYTAILTDTGSFRFANTTPRTHAIAADLLRRGVDPETVYRRIYANVPLRRLKLLQVALQNLEVDTELPIAWISLPAGTMEELDAATEDLDGIVDYARSVEGTEVALLFRETNGGTKVSFRSSGDVDVNELARRFGGGGHVKASGAVVGAPLDRAVRQVLDAARDAVRALEGPSGSP